jgi:GDP-D-mannose dehydratase
MAEKKVALITGITGQENINYELRILNFELKRGE